MQILSLTDAAAARLQALAEKSADASKILRLSVKKGGCAGMEYDMEFVSTPQLHDEVVSDKGATLVIDSKAVLYLIGTVMDYKIDKLSSGFVFQNPNQISACGCGESVQLVEAKRALS